MNEASAPQPDLRGIQNLIIATQCLGMLAHVFIQNNFVLLYFLALGLQGNVTLILLSATAFLQTALVIPCALLCERFGKKQIGTPGNILLAVGFSVFAVIPWIRGHAVLFSCLGILVYSAGNAMHRAGWFALIDPAIPAVERGRFFGRMRFAFILVGICFSMVAGLFLREGSSLGPYQVFILLTSLALAGQVVLYRRIPDLQPWKTAGHELKIPRMARELLGQRSYILFNLYILLLTFFSDGAHALFGLHEKQNLGLNATVVAYLGNAMLVGMLGGFLCGGRVTDRKGAALSFLLANLGYIAALALFIACARWFPDRPLVLGFVHALYGFTRGFFSIAFTHEMLALVPGRLKSLSTTLTVTMANIGGGLSLLVSGLLVDSRLAGRLPGVTAHEAVLLVMVAGLGLLLPLRRWRRG